MGKYQLQVQLSVAEGKLEVKYFTDWYDFADYIKQCNEQRIVVAIHRWQYVE